MLTVAGRLVSASPYTKRSAGFCGRESTTLERSTRQLVLATQSGRVELPQLSWMDSSPGSLRRRSLDVNQSVLTMVNGHLAPRFLGVVP
jgi:hypothetical protein